MYNMIILTGVTMSAMLTRAIGAYAVAHAVRQTGRTVQVIDYTDYFFGEELYHAVKGFIGPETKFIGVSSTFYQRQNLNGTSDSWLDKNFEIGLPDNIVNTIKKLKQEFPNIKFLLGGANSGYYEQYPFFDAVFHSYSDTSIIEYIENNHRLWPKKLGMSFIEGEEHPVNVEHLTHKWLPNDFIMPGETLPIEISRGCIFKCKFCNFQLTGKNKLDYLRDVSILKDELIYNYENFGTVNYTFADDTFNDSMFKLEQLHKAITDLPFKINFTTYMRLDLLYAHREQIQLVKELGLKSAFFGIESYNPKTAKAIGKGMASDKVKDFLLELRQDHFKEDINFICSFILGLPYEDLKSVEKTFEWNQAHDINSLYLPLFIRHKARYKSDIDQNYEKYGYKITGESNYWENEFTNFNQANEIAMKYNNATNNYLHSWFLFAVASLGVLPINELQKLRAKSVPPEIMARGQQRLIELVTDYKKKIYGSIQRNK